MLEVYDYYGYRNEHIFLDLCSLEHYFRCGLTISRVCDGSSIWESSLGENKDLVWRKPWIITFILLTSGKGFICSLDVEARQHVYIIEGFSLGFYHLATQWDFGWRMSWVPFIGKKWSFKFDPAKVQIHSILQACYLSSTSVGGGFPWQFCHGCSYERGANIWF